MQITILGNSGPYPRAGGACSGYLLEDERFKILLDCGNGVLSRLLGKIKSLNDLDAIILSHLHFDHISDIMVMKYAIGINQEKGMTNKSIPLYAPNDPQDIYDMLQFKNAFKLNELNSKSILTFGDMKISFELMSHPITTYAVIVEKKGKKFVYTSDTKYCDVLIEMSKEAELLLCECNLLEKDKTEDAYHLSAREVGEVAALADVNKLLLTHIWPEYDLNEVLNEVKIMFSGDVEIATELETFEI
ncbi:MBL fold metallo-hydrolase [Paramaledivibacter caminithermalis]|jgi:ribonuclease BN (tRNA processing enzyme)|uniref:Ribonuclease BN, tRNA processing enzyme n=1 Tax=Paramaledivibacter caminithermalis (strain DSM 15212 / CIP 107654 / DViRD3) TaxID=1121301 RepID=A0A1M6M643_PARC5|nr:MBL fold metallo-hydrolase [Paramaledivibacter caminithermalis]SHJ78954.1 Ribonuclease BN, tRNA processing enzyme [Paramaledivibacter caminithermalis DSM 15212]